MAASRILRYHSLVLSFDHLVKESHHNVLSLITFAKISILLHVMKTISPHFHGLIFMHILYYEYRHFQLVASSRNHSRFSMHISTHTTPKCSGCTAHPYPVCTTFLSCTNIYCAQILCHTPISIAHTNYN